MEKKLLIEGMHCNNCVNHLKSALAEDIEGVEVKEVSLAGKFAIVDMAETVTEAALKALMEELGFELVGIE